MDERIDTLSERIDIIPCGILAFPEMIDRLAIATDVIADFAGSHTQVRAVSICKARFSKHGKDCRKFGRLF